MGFFDNLFSKSKPDKTRVRETFRFIEGYSPTARTFQGEIYESELIRASIDAHGRHSSKLKISSTGSAKPTLKARAALAPNPWQTWPKFLYQGSTILYAKNTLFIVPVFDKYGEIGGFQNILPHKWELLDVSGEAWLRFYLDKGKRAACELRHVGIVTRFQYGSQLFGESNTALKQTLDLQEIQRQGVEEAVKNGASYRFWARSNNWSKDSDLKKERERFDEYNFRRDNGGGGLLIFPNTLDDIHQAEAKPYTVDADQQKIIKENVFDYFGTNEEILQNSATGDKWAAFYEGGPEWFALNLAEALTMMSFTERERQAGNAFHFSSNRLQYMTTQEKLNYITQMGDRGLITRNEGREVFNLPPLEEPFGSQVFARGEYYNVTDEPGDGSGTGDGSGSGTGDGSGSGTGDGSASS